VDQGRKHLGEWVKQERRIEWRTQKEFAQACRCSERSIIRLEGGHYVGPDVIARVVATLGFEPNSAELVMKGRKPRRVVDPRMARLQAIWPQLSIDVQRTVVDLAEKFLPPG
jgi:hypothetical protein